MNPTCRLSLLIGLAAVLVLGNGNANARALSLTEKEAVPTIGTVKELFGESVLMQVNVGGDAIVCSIDLNDLYKDRQIYGEDKLLLLDLLLDEKVKISKSDRKVIEDMAKKIASEPEKHRSKATATGVTALEIAVKWVKDHPESSVRLDKIGSDRPILRFHFPNAWYLDKDLRKVRVFFNLDEKHEKKNARYLIYIGLDDPASASYVQETEEDRRILSILTRRGHPEALAALNRLSKVDTLKPSGKADDLFEKILSQAFGSFERIDFEIGAGKSDRSLWLAFLVSGNGRPNQTPPPASIPPALIEGGGTVYTKISPTGSAAVKPPAKPNVWNVVDGSEQNIFGVKVQSWRKVTASGDVAGETKTLEGSCRSLGYAPNVTNFDKADVLARVLQRMNETSLDANPSIPAIRDGLKDVMSQKEPGKFVTIEPAANGDSHFKIGFPPKPQPPPSPPPVTK